ncbi:MAG TPA: hypothetical protein DER01_00680 [Phycisphaerales bacterium]|nr:hypothetical protein [Phycisphaerales bacterium]|tara:strand:+ start:1515 stop:1877 length:363 start_codon:yes stop_codon:yes gene_type:complete
MRNFITLTLLGILVIVLGGCATTDSQPANKAKAEENGGSWTDQVADNRIIIGGDIEADDKPVTKKRAQVYVENLTINQSITAGAEAQRGGEVAQTPTIGDTQQTPTNSPTTNTDLDLPLP